MQVVTLDSKISELVFHKGCQTIPSALRRSGFLTLKEVRDAMLDPNWKWQRVGSIRRHLIENWFDKCVSDDK